MVFLVDWFCLSLYYTLYADGFCRYYLCVIGLICCLLYGWYLCYWLFGWRFWLVWFRVVVWWWVLLVIALWCFVLVEFWCGWVCVWCCECLC